MLGLRKINPAKIVEARGERTRNSVAQRAGNKFTERDLYNWEKGLNLPREERLPYLLLGLGVTYDQITDEVSLEIAG